MKKNIKVAAIIAEYNPFHNGHKYHIEETKRITGADYVISIISGDFVQRGEPAMIDKYARTTMALNCGADLVLELPSMYATNSAEYFAHGAVSILDKLGVVNYLCFGSECNDIDLMKYIAKIFANPPKNFTKSLTDYVKKGNSYPKSRELALIDYLKKEGSLRLNKTKHIISSPNNILGIEYLKALIKLNSTIQPITILREDNGYNNTQLASISHMSSASSLRASVNSFSDNPSNHITIKAKEEGFRRIKKYVPDEVYSILKSSYGKTYPISYNDFSSIAIHTLLTTDTKSLTKYADVDETIANKLINSVCDNNSITTITELLELSKSKDLTYARLSRALLHIILKQETSMVDNLIKKSPEYVRILGFRSEASSLIKLIKKNSSLNIINKITIGKKSLSPIAVASLKYDIMLSELYSRIVTLKYGTTVPNEYKRGIIIIE